jgi:hypothetical protein
LYRIGPAARQGVRAKWQNAVAHHNAVLPPGGPLTVPTIQRWRNSCDTLAQALDKIMYNQLRGRLRREPWVP